MSNALAIASVTAVLKDLLDNAAIDGGLSGNVKVTVLPPDMVKDGDNKNELGLNLFLYGISPNQGWRNANLPAYDAGGKRIDNNPLAVDLYYLLTAYGKASYDAEILLGYAMQLLHERPVLSRQSIRDSLAKATTPLGIQLSGLKDMSASDLADQVELIKIIPHQLSVEDLSKLWTAFQTSYRPSVAYQVSVVLIETKEPVKRALPVSDRVWGRGIYTIPHGRPVIESISSQKDKDSDVVAVQPILSGYRLVLVGTNLKSDITKVRIDSQNLDGDKVVEAGDSSITALIPDDLPAGVHTAQVRHSVMAGKDHDEERPAMESNVVPFVLSPSIVGQEVAPPGPGEATIGLTLKPKVGRRQRVLLYLDRLEVPATAPAPAYCFPAPANNGIADDEVDETDHIDFKAEGLEPGTYLVRVQVDGVDSPLLSSGGEYYDTPQVNIE